MSGGGAISRPSGLRAPSSSLTSRPVASKMTTSSTSLSNSSGAILTEDTASFIIGNRVWVGGTKAGVIQYIGETQFAPGEWAGVVLDEPVGKNNGSVAGVQYFQCEPKRGVFSRLTKLTREPVESLMQAERQATALDDSSMTTRTTRANGSVRSTSPRSQTRSSTPSGDWTLSYRVGDRVQVTSAVGIKNGTLRYLGTTDFAPGEWAGIELDNATGKNDGAVEGTRYFNCPMKYGLFAPVHKVSRPGSAGRRSVMTASTTTPRRALASSLSPRKIGSQDSISTIGSTSKASSVTPNRGPRLGINSLTSSSAAKPSRSSAASVTATHTAMQESLKEKAQHIEQLMKERDMERAEVVRAAAQVDEAERELSSAKALFQKRTEEDEMTAAKLREAIAEAETRAAQLQQQLDEEKKKVEDLQFRVEEEAINKGDLESAKDLDAARIRELEELVSAERARAELLEHESNLNFQGEEELLTKHLDEIEDLKMKLTQAEDLVKSLESTKVSEGVRASQAAEELVTQRDSRLTELEDIVQRLKTSEAESSKNLDNLRETLQEREKTIAAHEAAEIELDAKLRKLEIDFQSTTKRTDDLQLENSDLRRSLQATQENFDSVCEQKEKLQAENMKQMKSSGDNSSQLIKLTEEFREKERELETLRLREQTTRQQSQKLREQIQGQHQREVEALGTKHWEEVGRLEESVRTSRDEAEQLRAVCAKLEAELSKVQNNHEVQLSEWRRSSEEQGNQAAAIGARLQDALKAGDEGRTAVQELKAMMEQKLTEALTERNSAIKEASELAGVRSTLEREKIELEGRVSQLETDRVEHAKAVSERDSRLAVLNAEVDRLKADFDRHRVELQRQLAETTLDQEAVLNMRSHLELQQKNLEVTEERLRLAEEEKLRLRGDLAQAQAAVAHKTELQAKASALEKQLEESRTRASQWQHNNEDEKETLQKMLQATQTLLEQRELEVSSLQEQMNVKSADAIVEAKQLREEKSKLEAQLAEQLSVSKRISSRSSTPVAADTNTSTTDATVQKLLEDKEALEGQIDFLNSIIVDMQRKNDDLASKITVLEMGDLLHGSSDVNLNAINVSAVPPRLFCDICDVFDVHDTEDCPKQETADGPPPTQYHGTRHQERPYCDICEVFGHWTNECDDNETF